LRCRGVDDSILLTCVHADESSHKKKRKSSKSDDVSNVEPVKKHPSPASSSEASEQTKNSTPAVEENPLNIDNFGLCAPLKSLLREKGIESLFAIQAQCLEPLLEGKDLVGRARTGCGKTLAFVLPIVESLAKDSHGGRRPHGRNPSVVVLAPTRELAKQVAADFEHFAKAANLTSICLYGGTPYGPQEGALRRGMDVVIGTPGRVKDHIERGSLNLKDLRFRVLDECDEMLNMGFVEDVETILTANVDADKVQTLLFSATLPQWVQDVKRRFLKSNHVTVDLVGTDVMKASTSVRHMLLPSHWSQRSSLVSELVKCYGAGGRTIVFTETKKDANELTASLSEGTGSRALHGDIPQSTREQTLQGFRSGNFNVLVATDVAARGLDIKNVELVIQVEPPKDPETYIHRSGRTGRAGSTGISITLVDRRKEGLIPYIQKKAGLTFERIGAPQPADIAEIAAQRAVESLSDVSETAIMHFRAAASKFLETAKSPEDALAAALAKITGHKDMKQRSLLTAHDDYLTLQFENNFAFDKAGFVFGFLRRRMGDENKVNEIKRMTLTEDGKGAVFDVPSHLKEEFLEKCAGEEGTSRVIEPSSLPQLKERPQENFGGYNNRGGYNNNRGGSGGGWHQGSGGYSRGGQRGGSSSYSRGGRGGWSGGGQNRFSRR
jgi:ATP-dependent RNA helicase DDX21